METSGRFIKAIALMAGLMVAFTLLFLWVPDATPENMVHIHGTLEEINESGGEHDIVFKLRNDPGRYFINRGPEKGLNTDSLEYYALNREVDLYVVKMRFNLLRPMHIAKVTSGDRVLYSSLR